MGRSSSGAIKYCMSTFTFDGPVKAGPFFATTGRQIGSPRLDKEKAVLRELNWAAELRLARHGMQFGRLFGSRLTNCFEFLECNQALLHPAQAGVGFLQHHQDVLLGDRPVGGMN